MARHLTQKTDHQNDLKCAYFSELLKFILHTYHMFDSDKTYTRLIRTFLISLAGTS